MAGLYFEQFSQGQRFVHEWTRTLTEMDNVLFSSLTMNVQPLHIDADYSARTEFGRPLINSLFTLGLLIGMTVNDTTFRTTVANLGMTDVLFPKPLFAGDTIHAKTKVIGTRASKSRPQTGIVEFEHSAYNQKDELVAQCRRSALMHRMPVGQAA